MEEFKASKLIVAQGKKVMQIESLGELVDIVFGEQYKNLSQKEKLQQRYKNALSQSIVNNIPIVYSEKGIIGKDRKVDKQTPYRLEESFIIDDETTFILSLCKMDELRILERDDANIFLTNKEKESMAGKDGNYIFVNAKADEIMRRHFQQNRGMQEP